MKKILKTSCLFPCLVDSSCYVGGNGMLQRQRHILPLRVRQPGTITYLTPPNSKQRVQIYIELSYGSRAEYFGRIKFFKFFQVGAGFGVVWSGHGFFSGLDPVFLRVGSRFDFFRGSLWDPVNLKLWYSGWNVYTDWVKIALSHIIILLRIITKKMI